MQKSWSYSFAAIALVFFLVLSSGSQEVSALKQVTIAPNVQSGGDWNSFIFDFNNSRYNSASTITSSNVKNIVQKWKIITGFSITSTPVVSNDTVYFADWGGNVYSANLTTGIVNWQVNLGKPISSTLALAYGLVYVGMGPESKTVFALNQNNGSPVWQYTINGTTPSIFASPTIYNGMLYIGTSGENGVPENNKTERGEVDALNATTGAFIWKTVTGVSSGGAGVWGSIVVDPELNSIYFGTGNSFGKGPIGLAYSIVSLNADSGNLNWNYSVFLSHGAGHDYDFGSTPDLFTLNESGTIIPAIGLGSKDYHYYVLNRVNGTLIDDIRVSNRAIIGVAGFTYPSPDDPEVFVPTTFANETCSCGEVAALFPINGSIAWKTYTPVSIIGSVALIPGAVIVGDGSGRIFAISMTSGAIITSRKIPQRILGGVTVAEGYILVGNTQKNPTETGSKLGLYAYGLK